MDKEAVVYIHIYIMEHYSAIKRNAFESVLMRWMNLESIIQSDMRQNENYKYIPVQFSHSVVSDSLRLHGLACQAPLSMGFSRQEHWRG